MIPNKEAIPRRAHSPEEIDRIKTNLFRQEVLEHLTNRQFGELLHAPLLRPLTTSALILGLIGVGLVVTSRVSISSNLLVEATVENTSRNGLVVATRDQRVAALSLQQPLRVWTDLRSSCLPAGVELAGLQRRPAEVILDLRITATDLERCNSETGLIANGERVSLVVPTASKSVLSFVLEPRRREESR